MHAVVLERNKLVGRKVARAFVAARATASVAEDPAQATALLERCDVLCGDAFDGDFIAEQARARRLPAVLWTAEPLKRSLRYVVETPTLDHVVRRRDFGSPPALREVVALARRLVEPGSGPLPLGAYLDWGYASLELEVRRTGDRDAAALRVQELVGRMQVPKRIVESCAELAHELIMNALYDAPVDAVGAPRFAADRKADVRLADHERIAVHAAIDASRFVLRVSDPFGSLERRHVLDGLTRGLAAGELDGSHGGAGLGLAICHNASSALCFEVARGRYTEVTAVVDLELNSREHRTQAKSLHWWSA